MNESYVRAKKIGNKEVRRAVLDGKYLYAKALEYQFKDISTCAKRNIGIMEISLELIIQLFMPGKPQIWYLDLFAKENDYEAVRRGGSAAHKEITNRTNLSLKDIEEGLKKDIVLKQLEIIYIQN